MVAIDAIGATGLEPASLTGILDIAAPLDTPNNIRAVAKTTVKAIATRPSHHVVVLFLASTYIMIAFLPYYYRL